MQRNCMHMHKNNKGQSCKQTANEKEKNKQHIALESRINIDSRLYGRDEVDLIYITNGARGSVKVFDRHPTVNAIERIQPILAESLSSVQIN